MTQHTASLFARIALVLVGALTATACGPQIVVRDVCGENDGVYEGSITMADDVYYDEAGNGFAVIGGGFIKKCREITGDLVLTGDIKHLDDFNNLERVRNVYYSQVEFEQKQTVDVDLPQERQCSLIGPFESLTHVEGEVRDLGGHNLCVEKFGFERLEYVGGDFLCGRNREVGASLRHVGGDLGCGSPLDNLEYAGELSGPAYLPNLVFAGYLVIQNREGDVIDLSSLEQVGPLVGPPSQPGLESELRIIANDADRILLPKLEYVEGDIEIKANRGEAGGPLSLTEVVREELADTENTGRRIICANGPGPASENDPCPYSDGCIDFYGEMSIYCCELPTWSECLEEFGEEPQ